MIRYVVPFRSPVLVRLAPAVMMLASVQASSAQEVREIHLNYGTHFSGATAASLQIQAEAQYLRAYGQMEKDLSEARIHHARAVSLELDNRQKALQNHFEELEAREARRAREVAKRLKSKGESDKRILERLKLHPEMNGTEIQTGTALNFLKNRLSSAVVTFRSASMGSREAVQEVAAQLHVTPQIVHALQVRQNTGRGESFVFRLDEGKAIQVDWWPPALRAPELKAARAQFEAARKKAFEQQTSDEFDVSIRKLVLQHAALEEAFMKLQAHATRTKTVQAWESYNDGKAFLQSLSGEIRRMEKLGPGRSSPESLTFKGNELPELLTHMVRNGLEFAPAKPGDESGYQQVFHMLRDLYVAYEADKEMNGT